LEDTFQSRQGDTLSSPVPTPINQRFNDSTRGRIVALLRLRPRTVEELAAELGLTDNAVRPHLVGLERDGMVRQAGARRREGAGKPAVLYELHPDAEPLLSRAYAPVLGALLEVLTEQLSERDARKVLRETGRRLAASVGGRAPGDLQARARAAATVLTALGGSVNVEEHRGSAILRGAACPLATAVSRSPHICGAVESLVAEISGAKVAECCDRTDRPRCCFELRSAAR
jgi:predicted ArsR family transcriptional regulator